MRGCRLLLLSAALLWPGQGLLAGNPPPFEVLGKEIEIRGREIFADGEPVYLRGICYSPFIAGAAPWDGRVPHVNFAHDLHEIKEELGANAVRVYQVIQSRAFYDKAEEEGLWVIQGIHINVPPGGGDLLSRQQLDEIKAHFRREVDLIHEYDASDVILCYVIGNEVPTDSIRQVIEDHQDHPPYRGRFFFTPDELRLPRMDGGFGCSRQPYKDPHPFQSLIAELADEVAIREADRHGVTERRLYGHASDPRQSIAASARNHLPDDVPVDMSFLDIIFQNVYGYFPPSLRFRGLRWYLEEARLAYPDNPFVVLESGYSTSPRRPTSSCAADRFCDLPEQPQPYSYCFGGNSEPQQARGILEQFRQATADPLLTTGYFVFEFYDEWWKTGEPTVHNDDRPEEWFGIKAVEGTILSPIIRNKLAFDTVGRMFGMFDPDGWCPKNSDLECKRNSEGTEITLGASEELDKVVLMRDGRGIDERRPGGPGVLTFLDDTDLSPGTYVYSIRVEDAFVVCEEEIQCEIVVPASPAFKRGDADGEDGINITDPIFLLEWLFSGGTPTSCQDAADSNDDNRLDITDGIYLLSWLFAGGPKPPAPGPDDCGADPNTALGCESFPPCAGP